MSMGWQRVRQTKYNALLLLHKCTRLDIHHPDRLVARWRWRGNNEAKLVSLHAIGGVGEYYIDPVGVGRL